MSWRRSRALEGGIIAVLVLSWVGSAAAAIVEFDLRQSVANSVAVLRYLNRQCEDYKDKLKMVDYGIKLTKQQQEAHKALVDRVSAADEPQEAKDVKLGYLKKTLQTLDYHVTQMTKVDFEKLYNSRIEMLTKDMDKQHILLDAKLTEYKVLFGGEPPVSLEYKAKESRFRPKVERPGVLVVR